MNKLDSFAIDSCDRIIRNFDMKVIIIGTLNSNSLVRSGLNDLNMLLYRHFVKNENDFADHFCPFFIENLFNRK